jgi:flagellar basal-body rod protein FlgC
MVSCANTNEAEVDAFFLKLNVLTIKKNTILMNIQNTNTTRTESGGAYVPVEAINCIKVKNCELRPLKSTGIGAKPNSPRSPVLKYEKDHPDSNHNGYVAYPNINLVEENNKLRIVQRAIKFLFKNMPVSHDFFFSSKSSYIFEKYPALNDEYNFKNLIEL